MILILSMMMNILFMNFNNPLLLGLILLIQTIIISMMIGKMNLTFWFSYIIFLIFIGGMLILFIYVISLINNKFLYFNYNFFLKMMMLIFIINYMMKWPMLNNYESMNNSIMLMKYENIESLLKLYNLPNLFIYLMLIIYLFIMMIMSTNFTKFSLGPFFKY